MRTLADRDSSFSGQAQYFLKNLSCTTDSVLSHIYGRRLFSYKAYFTSAAICIAFLPTLFFGESLLSTPVIAYIIIITLLGCVSFKIEKFFIFILIAATASLSLAVYLIFGLFGNLILKLILISLPISSLIDFLAIAIIRWGLRKTSNTNRLRTSILFLAASLFSAPIFVVTACTTYWSWRYTGFLNIGAATPYVPLMIVSLNSSVLITSTLWVLLLFTLAAYRIVLSFAPRFLYSIIRYKILENRKIVSGIGVACLGMSFPDAVPILERYAKLFGS